MAKCRAPYDIYHWLKTDAFDVAAPPSRLLQRMHHHGAAGEMRETYDRELFMKSYARVMCTLADFMHSRRRYPLCRATLLVIRASFTLRIGYCTPIVGH